MENNEFEKLPAIFNKYGARLSVDYKTETQDLAYIGCAMRFQYMMDTGVSMNIDFRGTRGFTHFVDDLVRLDELYDEEYQRRHNPVLQRAWEEYQILLKLTK